jgi:hypothetical protein
VNIFVLNYHPQIAAMDLCDKHLSKMLLESCQLLSTTILLLDPESHKDLELYRQTHVNHPAAIWTRQSQNNFLWLVAHADQISKEYFLTYGKHHKSEAVLYKCAQWANKNKFSQVDMTPHAQCMPDEYKNPDDAVSAYRNYYLEQKKRFAKWKNRAKPTWWPNEDLT